MSEKPKKPPTGTAEALAYCAEQAFGMIKAGDIPAVQLSTHAAYIRANTVGENLLYHYRCRVLKVVDGDTLDVEIDLGFRMTRQERIRLLGIDAPERGTEAGYAARNAVIGWVSRHSGALSPWLFLHTSKGDSFGRWLGVIESQLDSATLNDWLVDNNHAVRMAGRY